MQLLCDCIESRFTDAGLMNGCICSGDVLTYECTAMGTEVATIWTGSAFDCPASNNMITLLHSRFLYNESSGIYHCNNGAIVTRSLSFEGNSYTSQLNVTVTPDIGGKTIKCAGDNGIIITYHFSLKLPTVIGLSLA